MRILITLGCFFGRAIAHAVSVQLLTAEARVHTQVSVRGFVDEVTLGKVFISPLAFPCQHYPTDAS